VRRHDPASLGKARASTSSGRRAFRVLAAGGDAARCTFAGVGKSREEIEFALAEGVFSFNVESEAELAYINPIAAAKNVRAPIALRVNPDVTAGTHKYVSTGGRENKFGIALDRIEAVYEDAARMANITVRGVQMHIGSQITKAEPFADAIAKIAPTVLALKKRYGLEFLSIGGMGITYHSSFASGQGYWWRRGAGIIRHDRRYAAAIVPILRPLGLRILLGQDVSSSVMRASCSPACVT
jgi:diaminopimelate decarboxylase